MAKAKKVTIERIMKAVERDDANEAVITCGSGENAVEFTVKKYLTVAERANMVSDIVDSVFVEADDGSIEYQPAFKEFAVGYYILNYFTNISLSNNVEKIWKVISETHIVDAIVSANKNKEYVDAIIGEATDAIEYKKQQLLKKTKFDELIASVLDVVNTIKKNTDNIDTSQILDFVSKNAPEFTEGLKKMLSEEIPLE